MSQVPLAPPPQTGQPIDSWLYLLWRRLTATGQMLWSSIVPGSSADVAAVVTDETGSPGSLVFSGNPTLQGLTVEDEAFVSRGITDNATATVTLVDSTNGLTITMPGATASMVIGDGANAASYRTLLGVTGSPYIFTTRPGDTARNNIALYVGSNDTNPSRIRGYKGRGGTSHGAVSSGDVLFSFQGYGSDGAAWINGAGFNFVVNGTVSSGNVPTDFSLDVGTTSATEKFRVSSDGTTTLGGLLTAPALKVTPVASQARWIEVTGATSSTYPTIGTSGGNLACSAVFMPKQATTAGAPAYVLGGMYFDTTLNKLRIGGATAWETVTSI